MSVPKLNPWKEVTIIYYDCRKNIFTDEYGWQINPNEVITPNDLYMYRHIDKLYDLKVINSTDLHSIYYFQSKRRKHELIKMAVIS